MAVDTEKGTETVTETTKDYTKIIQKRQASHYPSIFSIPAALQRFAPSVVSSACSANVPSHGALSSVTITRIFTKKQIQHVTGSQEYRTIDVSSDVDVGITIKSGDYRTTETEFRRTFRFTTTITTTETLESLASVTSTNTGMLFFVPNLFRFMCFFGQEEVFLRCRSQSLAKNTTCYVI